VKIQAEVLNVRPEDGGSRSSEALVYPTATLHDVTIQKAPTWVKRLLRYEDVDLIELAQDRVQLRALVNTVMKF